MPKETTITAAIVGWLRDRPRSYTLKLHGSVYGVAGVPDIMHIEGGLVTFIEVKQPGKRSTKLQLHHHGRLAAAGARVIVANNLKEVQHFFS